MDYFAISSVGTYPTPTPTESQRAAYAVSYGLIDGAAMAALLTSSLLKKWILGIIKRDRKRRR